ncbi:hypothetical protein DBK44_17855 [Salmonella enterica subsp. enterica serovar Typhi]|nr:hypothetical protein DBK44_17855 [Salmonella enterica subsp. enterica serovar Typhi]
MAPDGRSSGRRRFRSVKRRPLAFCTFLSFVSSNSDVHRFAILMNGIATVRHVSLKDHPEIQSLIVQYR